MGLKKVLMASTAVIVVLATADAAQAGGVYGTFSGGLNWTDGFKGSTADNVGPLISSFTADMSAETGFVVSVAVGWHLDDMVMKGLRVELEGAYRHNNAHGFATEFADNNPPRGGAGLLTSTSANHANLMTWSVMGNVWYDFDMGSRLRPYFGGGIGWARNKIVPKVTALPEMNETEGFAWQAGAGVNFVLSPSASVGLGYRYMDSGDKPTFTAFQGQEVSLGSGSVTHSAVMFSINYDLN